MGHLIIIFIVVIAFFIYVLWGQNDDFSFFVIFLLLSSTLYVLAIPQKRVFEAFTESATDVDIDSYKRLASLYSDVAQILQPKFAYIIAGFRGDAKPKDEQKFDSAGNPIDEKLPDEVPIDRATETDTRLLNRFLKDLQNFDPGAYYRLLGLATGQKNLIVEEEFPM